MVCARGDTVGGEIVKVKRFSGVVADSSRGVKREAEGCGCRLLGPEGIKKRLTPQSTSVGTRRVESGLGETGVSCPRDVYVDICRQCKGRHCRRRKERERARAREREKEREAYTHIHTHTHTHAHTHTRIHTYIYIHVYIIYKYIYIYIYIYRERERERER
jgi:hypothetical protein